MISSASFPDVLQLKIIDLNGQPLANIVRVTGEAPRALYDLKPELPPNYKNIRPIKYIANKKLLIWYPISTSHALGWIKAVYSLSFLDNVRSQIIVDNLSTGSLALIIDILSLLLILHYPMSALRSATEFSATLKKKNGAKFSVHKSSREIDQLVDLLEQDC